MDLSYAAAQLNVAYGCIVKLDLRLNDKASGVYEEGFSGNEICGKAGRLFPVNPASGVTKVPEVYCWNTVFSQAYDSTLLKMIAAINKAYPICGTVVHFKNKGSKTEFSVDRGTNYGITRKDNFLIYYVDSVGSITPVALAKGFIGREQSQVTVTDWNKGDSEVLNEIMPRIKRNDKSLLGSLFFVCRSF